MVHLSPEQLARLVDERPTTEEVRHLADCPRCRAELDAFREQTDALGSLPELLPPQGDWRVLEDRLRSEGLVRDPGLFARMSLASTPAWMKVAAAAVLFLSGAGTGAALTSPSTPELIGVTRVADGATVEDAATAVRQAEEQYVTAVSRYREMLAADGGEELAADPLGRVAALEHLVMVSQAAVRQAPGDPYLNGFLASAMAERDAALRMVSSGQDNWF